MKATDQYFQTDTLFRGNYDKLKQNYSDYQAASHGESFAQFSGNTEHNSTESQESSQLAQNYHPENNLSKQCSNIIYNGIMDDEDDDLLATGDDWKDISLSEKMKQRKEKTYNFLSSRLFSCLSSCSKVYTSWQMLKGHMLKCDKMQLTGEYPTAERIDESASKAIEMLHSSRDFKVFGDNKKMVNECVKRLKDKAYDDIYPSNLNVSEDELAKALIEFHQKFMKSMSVKPRKCLSSHNWFRSKAMVYLRFTCKWSYTFSHYNVGSWEAFVDKYSLKVPEFSAAADSKSEDGNKITYASDNIVSRKLGKRYACLGKNCSEIFFMWQKARQHMDSCQTRPGIWKGRMKDSSKKAFQLMSADPSSIANIEEVKRPSCESEIVDAVRNYYAKDIKGVGANHRKHVLAHLRNTYGWKEPFGKYGYGTFIEFAKRHGLEVYE